MLLSSSNRERISFQEYLSPPFLVCLAAYDKLRTQQQQYDDKTRLILSTEPIEDLLELSGYALIYSELDNKGYWNVVKELWNKYLSKHDSPQDLIKFIMDIIEYRRSQFAILPRSIVRTKWTQNFEARLRDRGLLGEKVIYRRLQDEEIERHPSALIRVLTYSEYMIYDALDVFLSIYFSEYLKAYQLTIPRRAEVFSDRLKREMLKKSEKEGEES